MPNIILTYFKELKIVTKLFCDQFFFEKSKKKKTVTNHPVSLKKVRILMVFLTMTWLFLKNYDYIDVILKDYIDEQYICRFTEIKHF